VNVMLPPTMPSLVFVVALVAFVVVDMLILPNLQSWWPRVRRLLQGIGVAVGLSAYLFWASACEWASYWICW
jgi:hypothetical protein